MTQVLHIFKKDVHRHWPEILISLALLVLYARYELQLEQIPPQYDPRLLFFIFVGRSIPLFLTLSWIFLVLRVVQSETLVGDRQWWVTKPYVWWELLLSKLFFVFVFISVPLFHVQLLLLHRAGFPVLPNLVSLFLMQLTLPLVLIVCFFALAALTKNLAQALLGIGIAVVALIVGQWLNSLSSQTMGDSSPIRDGLAWLLVIGSLVLVPVWQFARRRTWASRITLAACFGATTVLSLIPVARRIEQSYPLLPGGDSPAQFTIPSIPESHNNSSNSPRFASDPFLSIPMNVSGIEPGSVVLVDGMEITVDSADDSRWIRAWVSQYVQLWPGKQRQDLRYQVKHKEYERVKTKLLKLHIQLALSEYREADERTIVIPATTLRDSVLGICSLAPGDYRFLQCRKPFHSPSYIGRFDAPSSPCRPVQGSPDGSLTNVEVAYALAMLPTEGIFPEPGLNPIREYPLTFNSPARVPDANSTVQSRYSVTALCPGAEIRLGRPVRKRQFRIQLELPNVRLEDLVERTFGISGGSIGVAY